MQDEHKSIYKLGHDLMARVDEITRIEGQVVRINPSNGSIFIHFENESVYRLSIHKFDSKDNKLTDVSLN